jgi:hypothetical protein
MTVPALLAHIVIMLAVTSVLTVVNLLAGPRVWWALAVLVLWLALVIIHAIGLATRSLLFVEEDGEPAPPRVRPEPLGPAVPGWLSLPRRNVREPEPEPEPRVPESWELKDDTAPAWPAQPLSDSPLKKKPASDEKVPWRAATDIAWLRRPRATATDGDEPPASKEASS